MFYYKTTIIITQYNCNFSKSLFGKLNFPKNDCFYLESKLHTHTEQSLVLKIVASKRIPGIYLFQKLKRYIKN